MALSIRKGKFEPFLNIRFAENDQYVGFQAGLTTYGTNEDGEETYQTTYTEVGGRSDHLIDAVDQLTNQTVTTRLSADAGSDSVYITPAEADNKVVTLEVA